MENYPVPKQWIGQLPQATASILQITGTTASPTKGTIDQDTASYILTPNTGLLILNYNFRQTGIGSAGIGTYLFGMPAGYQADLTKIPGRSSNSSMGCVVGNAYCTTATSQVQGIVGVWDADHLFIEVLSTISTLGLIGHLLFGLGLSAVSYSFSATVPIAY